MKKIICIDLETTGLSNEDEILQVSIIDYNENVILNEYVKPLHKKEWKEAMAVNGITPEKVSDKPSIMCYKANIKNILENADVIVGFNHINYDMPMIERLLDIKVDKSKLYDVMLEYCKKNNITYNRIKLAKVCESMKIVNDKAHDGVGDTKATIRAYKKLVNEK